MAKAILQDPLPIKPPAPVVKSWDIVFDIRQLEAEHPNGHYCIHKETGQEWGPGELDPKIFRIVRCKCAEEDLPVFRSWKRVMREQYVYDIPTEVIGEIDTVSVEMIRVKVHDGIETRGWNKQVPYYKMLDGKPVDVSFQEVWKELIPGKYSLRLMYSEETIQEENWRIDSSIFTPTLLLKDNIYDIDNGTMKACLVATSTAIKQKMQKLFDTRQNAILTVGTGKTYSTISLAIMASSSGDQIWCYATTAMTYTEIIRDNSKDGIYLWNADGYLTLTIKNSTDKSPLDILYGYSWTVDGFVIDHSGYTGAGAIQAVYFGDPVGYLRNCYIKASPGVNTVGVRNRSLLRCCNVTVVGAGSHGFLSEYGIGRFLHCGAFNNGGLGWNALEIHRQVCFGCVAVGNVGGDFMAPYNSSYYINCASGDASAVGAGCATGLDINDFDADWKIKATVKDTTKAKFSGHPFDLQDVYGNMRKETGEFWAGWQTPDPVTTPSKPTLVLTDKGDGTGLEAELSGEYDRANHTLYLGQSGDTFVSYGSEWDSDNKMNIDIDNGKWFGYVLSEKKNQSIVSDIVQITVSGGGSVAATDNISVAKRAMKQTAVYWAPGAPNDFGKPTYDEPVEIDCRWSEAQEEIILPNGDREMSQAKLIVDRDLVTKGVLMLGTLDDVVDSDNPKNNSGAWEILLFRKTPNFKGTKFIRNAYL